MGGVPIRLCKTAIACVVGFTLGLASAVAQVADPKLYTSIVDGRVEELTAYLNAGGNPSATINVPDTSWNVELLDLAVRGSKEDPALVVLTAGARPLNPTEFVEIAAQKGFARVLAFVLDTDPSLVLHLRAEHHPLHLAAAGGHSDAVRILLAKLQLLGYAERDEILREALYVALNGFESGEAPAIVYDLLDAGVVPDTRALALAASRCEPPLVAAFLTAGADPRRREDLGRGPQSVAQHAALCFTTDENAAYGIFGELRAAGADVCDVDMADDRISEAARTYLREDEQCTQLGRDEAEPR
jgi:hypothetical protein